MTVAVECGELVLILEGAFAAGERIVERAFAASD